MPLSRQKAFLFLLFAAIGCSEATSPRLPATFELVNISGRSLPTYFSATPGYTTTVLSAYLMLQPDGSAFWIEDRRDEAGVVTSISNTFEYRIDDGRVEVGSFGPCLTDINCIGTYKGKVSKDALSLVMGPGTTYNYRTTIRTPID